MPWLTSTAPMTEQQRRQLVFWILMTVLGITCLTLLAVNPRQNKVYKNI